MTVPLSTRLGDIGLELPEPPTANGKYRPVVQHNGIAYVAGQLSRAGGEVITGPVSAATPQVVLEAAASACVGRALAALEEELGSLDRIARVMFVRGFVHGDDGFTEHSRVLDHVSELLHLVFGARGEHARSAVGVAGLPAGGLLEIELVVALDSPGHRSSALA